MFADGGDSFGEKGYKQVKMGQRGGAVGAGDGWVREVCSLESIGIYRNQSELIGRYRIFSEKF